MRIGFDAKRALTNKSGLGNYSRDILRSLNNMYPENEYILFSPSKETTLLEYKFTNNIISPKGLDSKFSSLWRSMRMGKEILEANLDIYHGLSNELPLNLTSGKVKKIVTIHDLIFLKYPELYKYHDRLIYNQKFGRACKQADKIIAISQQTKSDIINHYEINESKIDVIYQGCNPIFYEKSDQISLNKTKEKFNLPDDFILTVGTIEKRKNVLNVVKALYYFKIKVPYVIVGKPTSYLAEIETFAKKYGILNQIIVLKNVETVDLPSIYQLSRAFIYPSVYEGFGIPILEAQNSGIPIVTSEYGSTVEASGGAAVLVNPLDSKSIGIAIKAVLSEPKIRGELIDNGYKNAKKFHQEVVSKNLMEVYKSIL